MEQARMEITQQRRKAGGGLVVAHVVAATVLSLGFALALYGAEDPNIGAGLFLLPLWPLALPWSLLSLFAVDLGTVVIAGALGNAALHVALHARRHQFGFSRTSTVFATALLASTAVVLSVGASSAARRNKPLYLEVSGILPVQPWTPQSTTVNSGSCLFCNPQSADGQSVGLSGPPPPEATLRAAIDARMKLRGYQVDSGWDCANRPYEAEAPPETPDRECFRSYLKPGYAAFVRLRDGNRQSAALWLDITRQ